MSPGFIVTTVAGDPNQLGDLDGTGAAARFQYPQQLAWAGSRMLVADYWETSKLRAVAPDGVVTTAAGPTGFFKYPYDSRWIAAEICSSPTTRTTRFCKITAAGVVSTFAGAPGQSGNINGTRSSARFKWPRGLVIDASDNIFVADNGNGAIRKITPAGQVTTFGPPISAVGLAFDTSGNLYASASTAIYKLTPAAEMTVFACTPPLSGCADGAINVARFGGPAGLAFDSAGNLWVADASHTLRKVTPDGVVTTAVGQCNSYGGVDGVGTAARLDSPAGLAFDAAGNLFVTENSRIRRVKPDGTVTSLAGPVATIGFRNGRGEQAVFYSPSAVVVNPAGSLFITDRNSHVIRRADPYTVCLPEGARQHNFRYRSAARRAASDREPQRWKRV